MCVAPLCVSVRVSVFDQPCLTRSGKLRDGSSAGHAWHHMPKESAWVKGEGMVRANKHSTTQHCAMSQDQWDGKGRTIDGECEKECNSNSRKNKIITIRSSI